MESNVNYQMRNANYMQINYEHFFIILTLNPPLDRFTTL